MNNIKTSDQPIRLSDIYKYLNSAARDEKSIVYILLLKHTWHQQPAWFREKYIMLFPLFQDLAPNKHTSAIATMQSSKHDKKGWFLSVTCESQPFKVKQSSGFQMEERFEHSLLTPSIPSGLRRSWEDPEGKVNGVSVMVLYVTPISGIWQYWPLAGTICKIPLQLLLSPPPL